MSVGNTHGHSMCDFKTLTADTMKGYLIVYFLKVNCCMKLIPLKKNTMSHHRGSSHPRRFTLGSLQYHFLDARRKNGGPSSVPGRVG